MFVDDMHARVSQALAPKTYIQSGGQSQSQIFIPFGGDLEEPVKDF